MKENPKAFNDEIANIVREAVKASYETINALTTLFKGGTIDLCDVSEKIDDAVNKKEQAILEKHKEYCGIWQSESDKRWRTKVPDASKKEGRKLLVKSTKENLEKSIVEYYESLYGVKQSLSTVYLDWLTSKKNSTSLNNAKKLQYVWDKYYKKSSIIKIPLEQLTVGNIKDFLYEQLSTKELTKKQYNEMKSLINSMLDYSVDKEYISSNKARSVSRPSDNKFRIPKQKPIEEVVYTSETKYDAIKKSEELFNKTGNSAYLAICLNFTLGLRVGELVALETSDIKGNLIHIGKEELHTIVEDEKHVFHKCGTHIVPHTKTICGERDILLTPDSVRFIKKAIDYNDEHGLKDGDFIFLDKNGKRIRSDSIENALRKLNGKRNENGGYDIVGLPSGNHAIRRTYLSNLHEEGIPDDVLVKVAGHKDIATTRKHYLTPTSPLEDFYDVFASALSCHSKITNIKNCNPSVTRKKKQKEKRQAG